MSKTYTNTTQCCATCANWGGPRVEKLGSCETNGPGVHGKCYAGVPYSSTEGPIDCHGTYCDKYQKWGALK